jgi:hypothetical protein
LTKRKPSWDKNLFSKHKAHEQCTRPSIKEREIFIHVYNIEVNEALLKIYTNQTGCFPKKLSLGNQNVMVLVELNSSAVLVKAMKNCTFSKMICTYQHLIDRLKTAEIEPQWHVLQNECSAEFKDTIKKINMTFQLVPPHDHCQNIAEKGIQTFKAHFIAILCGTDNSFSLHLWCQLLTQAEHTLNMLHPS